LFHDAISEWFSYAFSLTIVSLLFMTGGNIWQCTSVSFAASVVGGNDDDTRHSAGGWEDNLSILDSLASQTGYKTMASESPGGSVKTEINSSGNPTMALPYTIVT
jgi:hypothetical protein